MGRWPKHTRVRLERAAFVLYLERGFEQTTVAEIAGRAGLTERTFFRYFADKREVLFGGANALQDFVAGAVAAAPEGAAPLEAVAAAFQRVVFPTTPEQAVQRQTIIAATPELQARELSKLASLSAAMAQALRGRGVPDPAASLTAEAGIVIFKSAFGRWINPSNQQDWSQLIGASLDDLKAVISCQEPMRDAQ